MATFLQVLKQVDAIYVLCCGALEIELCAAGWTFNPRHGVPHGADHHGFPSPLKLFLTTTATNGVTGPCRPVGHLLAMTLVQGSALTLFGR